MKLGVLGGTGQEGRGIALRLAKAGFDVLVGSRSRTRATRTASELNRLLGGESRIRGGLNADVATQSGTLFLAAPFTGAAELVSTCAPHAAKGTTWVDVTVPVVFHAGRVELAPLEAGSGSEQLAAGLPDPGALVAALKTVPARLLGEVAAPLDCDVFVCGKSPRRKREVAQLLSRWPGVRTVDAGPLSAARTLERMSALLIGINRRYGVHESRFRVVGL
jgi:NADPH-dependent F420 reductase